MAFDEWLGSPGLSGRCAACAVVLLMPRGVYVRGKLKELPERYDSQATKEKRAEGPPPARVCSRCAFFEAGQPDTFVAPPNGFCHWTPKLQIVNVDHWCGQWRGREGA